MLFIGLLIQSVILSHIMKIDVGEMFIYMASIEMFMLLFSVLNTTKTTLTSITDEVQATLQVIRNRLEVFNDSESESEDECGEESDSDDDIATVVTPVFTRFVNRLPSDVNEESSEGHLGDTTKTSESE